MPAPAVPPTDTLIASAASERGVERPQRHLPAHTRGLLGIGAALVAAYLMLWLLTPVILSMALGAAIYYLFAPIVAFGARHRVPRSVSAAGVYLGACGIVALLISWFGPRLHAQLTSLIDGIPEYGKRLREWVADTPFGERLGAERLDDLISTLMERADAIAERALGQGLEWMMSAVSFTFTGLVGLTLGFYLLVSGPKLAAGLPAWLPPAQRDRWMRFGRRASGALSGYLRSRLLASALIGVAYGVAFWAAGIEHALVLGVIGGAMNMLPIIGPFIAAVPAIAVASLQGIGAVIAVIVIMVIAQQIENHVLSPLLDGRMVSLPPVVVLLAVAVGAALFGLLGVLLATPMAAVLAAALDVFYRECLDSTSTRNPTQTSHPMAEDARPRTSATTTPAA